MAKKIAKKSAPARKPAKASPPKAAKRQPVKVKGVNVKGTMTGRASSAKSNIEEVAKPKLPSRSAGKPVRVKVQSGLAPHGVVIARAGCGKTSSMVCGIAHMFKDQQVGANTLWGKLQAQMGRKMVPTEQQEDIWAFMKQEIPRTIRYAAFNNSVVDEFSGEWGWLVSDLAQHNRQLSFSTIHSMGYTAIKQRYGMRIRMAWNKTRDLLSTHWGKDLNEIWKEKAIVIEAVDELVRLAKITLSADTSANGKASLAIEKMIELAETYDVEITGETEEIHSLVNVLLTKSMANETIESMGVDFDDMIWLPSALSLPVDQYDLLIVDEAQDLSAARMDIALRAGKRIITVGDDRQAIYGFAGAEVDSLFKIRDELAASPRKVESFPLNETFRCGKAIVSNVNRLVDDLRAHSSNPPGLIARVGWDAAMEMIGLTVGPGFSLGEVQAAEQAEALRQVPECEPKHDMVISRVNMPIVRLAFSLLRQGRRFEYRGQDMKRSLKYFIRKSGVKADVSMFLDWLDKHVKERLEKMAKRTRPNPDQMALLQDKRDCLFALAEGALSIKELNKSIDNIFCAMKCPTCNRHYEDGTENCYDRACKSKHTAGTRQRGWNQDKGVKLERIGGPILASVHRSKGLEAKRVWILRPDLMPHPLAKQEWEKKQEENLQYVAETRAKQTLVFVDGKPSSNNEEKGDGERETA